MNRDGSYIDSPSWIKNKRATINPKSADYKCLRDATVAALNYEKIRNHSERISNLKPFFDQYNWNRIEFPSHSKDWKSLNKTIIKLLLTFYMYYTILSK